MGQTLTMDRLAELRGAPVYDSAGEKIGKVEEIFCDYESNEPEWIGLGTGILGTKRVLVPVRGASVESDGVSVPYAKKHVKGAPDIDSDEISAETEQELYAYYSGGEVPDADAPTGRQASVTRHEEELQVGKRPVEAGTARLRKWVETEPVEMNVELKRETARVTREKVDEPVSDAAIGEDEVSVPLSAEQAVVAKQTVAKERIGIEKDVETEQQTLSEEVRKERVDVEDGSSKKKKR